MDTLTLYPSRRKWVVTLLVSIALGYGSATMIHGGQVLLGWACALFFALVGLVALAMLIPGLNGLRLTPEGFSLKTFGRTLDTWKIKWRDVESFFPLTIPAGVTPIKMVGINFTPEARAAMPPARATALSNTRTKYGADVSLPDNYSVKLEDLVALLNEWRARHAGR